MHLSDIHFGQERDGGALAINEDAKKRLIDDARDEVSKLGVVATGVVVTGDIAFSGKRHEYQTAAAWLASLTEAIGCERTDVQLIPGNHDIDREKITTSTECVLDAIRDRGDVLLDPMLDSAEDRKLLYARFEAYADFALDYQCELDLNGGFSNGARLTLAEGRHIRFVRLNSALICSRRDDEGKLILGKRQQPLPVEAGEELVVLVHHPLNWFQDSLNARRYLRSRARVVISGHEHYPKLVVDPVAEGCDLMLLAAGATNPDVVVGEYTYKYNILTFEWDQEADALAVSVNPRTWDEQGTCFKRDESFLDGKSERQVLASPNFRRAAPPQNAMPIKAEVVDVEALAEVVSECVLAATEEVSLVEEAARPRPDRTSPTVDERLLQLRFFQELGERERLDALVELGALRPDVVVRLDHAMERRLFRLLVKKGRAPDIERWLQRAEGEG